MVVVVVVDDTQLPTLTSPGVVEVGPTAATTCPPPPLPTRAGLCRGAPCQEHRAGTRVIPILREGNMQGMTGVDQGMVGIDILAIDTLEKEIMEVGEGDIETGCDENAQTSFFSPSIQVEIDIMISGFYQIS
mmetsp:Transcript_15840/g.23282  ORF Transcript_15840/g.23282 Transcript_15840/m.23282 type:complete len:132 (-) Transcript_15840:26-421(-)